MPELEQDDVVKAVLAQVGKSVENISLGVIGKPEFYLDTGNWGLNWCISGSTRGGYPGGRVVELFGDPSTGKSLLVYHAIASAMKQGGYAVLDDTEGAYIDVYGAALGVDNKKLILLNSVTVEEHFSVVMKLIAELREKLGPKVPIVAALDSLAQLTTEHEKTVEFEKPSMTKAKMIRLGLRLLRPTLVKDPYLVYLITNHVIANIGDMYNPTTTPGGSGVPFQSSVRLELGLRAKIREGERVLGVNSKCVVVKNKINPPFRECDLQVRFDKGVVRTSGLFEVAKLAGVVVPTDSKGWYKISGTEKKIQTAAFYEEFVEKAIELMSGEKNESTPDSRPAPSQP